MPDRPSSQTQVGRANRLDAWFCPDGERLAPPMAPTGETSDSFPDGGPIAQVGDKNRRKRQNPGECGTAFTDTRSQLRISCRNRGVVSPSGE